MPPSIHPVHLITVLRHKSLTPVIVFLTSRRSCDDALQAFDHTTDVLPPARQEAISAVLDELMSAYPSLQDHPLRKTVTAYGVAAHHAGHLPSWKIAIEELMRRGCLDAVFATTTLAAGVDFPARTVVLTQSGVRRDQDFTDLTVAEVAQISGRAGIPWDANPSRSSSTCPAGTRTVFPPSSIRYGTLSVLSLETTDDADSPSMSENRIA